MAAGAVLITRPKPGADETAARVASLGLRAIIAPVLEIRQFPMPPPRGTPSAILLTSGNAVEALPASCHAIPVLAVGAATARRASHAGFADVSSADGDAEALAALVRARIRAGAGTLLLASGRHQGLRLAARLRASGYRVTRRVAYDAVPVERLPEPARLALTEARVGAVLLFSAATARHFLRLVRGAGLLASLARCDAITIGPQVGVALQRSRWARIHVASEPNQNAMLALLQ